MTNDQPDGPVDGPPGGLGDLLSGMLGEPAMGTGPVPTGDDETFPEYVVSGSLGTVGDEMLLVTINGGAYALTPNDAQAIRDNITRMLVDLGHEDAETAGANLRDDAADADAEGDEAGLDMGTRIDITDSEGTGTDTNTDADAGGDEGE